MKKRKSLYHGHRFPAAVISCAVRWYFRFSLSLRDIEELLLERGVVVTYETIRCWCGSAESCWIRYPGKTVLVSACVTCGRFMSGSCKSAGIWA
jgi:hypothetical protein